jgi:hypothetical protein
MAHSLRPLAGFSAEPKTEEVENVFTTLVEVPEVDLRRSGFGAYAVRGSSSEEF